MRFIDEKSLGAWRLEEDRENLVAVNLAELDYHFLVVLRLPVPWRSRDPIPVLRISGSPRSMRILRSSVPIADSTYPSFR